MSEFINAAESRAIYGKPKTQVEIIMVKMLRYDSNGKW